MKFNIFKTTLKRTLWLFYDNLGLFLIVNLLWCACACTIVLLPGATFAIFYLVRKIIQTNDACIKDYVSNIFSCFFKRFFCLFSLIFSFLFIGYVFFVYTHIEGFKGPLFFILKSLSFCFFLIYMMSLLYFLPLYENKEFYGIKSILDAVLLAIILYPFTALFVVAFLLIFKIIMAILIVGMFLILTTFNIVFLVNLNYIVFAENLNNKKSEYLEALDKRKFLEVFFPFQNG